MCYRNLTVLALMFNLALGIDFDVLAIIANTLGIVLGDYGGYTQIREDPG